MGNEQALRALRRAAWRLAAWQLAVTVTVAGAAALIGGGSWARSALVGGGIGILAGLYQALRMFRVDASQNPAGYLGSVYASEALKIVLTVALFIGAIRTLQVELVPVIVAYAATFGVYWVALSTDFPWLKPREPGK
jgi:ATP synthase protein I